LYGPPSGLLQSSKGGETSWFSNESTTLSHFEITRVVGFAPLLLIASIVWLTLHNKTISESDMLMMPSAQESIKELIINPDKEINRNRRHLSYFDPLCGLREYNRLQI
jgi:hypothetical protein